MLHVTGELNVAHNATNGQVVAVLIGNAGFNSRFVAESSSPTGTTGVTGTLNAGTTTGSFTVQYSEATGTSVTTLANYGLDVDNNGVVDITAIAVPLTGIDNPLFPTRVTVDFTTGDPLLVPGTATRLNVSNVLDLAGNVISPNLTCIAVVGLTPSAP